MSKKNNNKSFNRRQFLEGSFYGMTLKLMLPTMVSLIPKDLRSQMVPNAMNLFVMYLPDGTYPHSINPNGTLRWDRTMSRWYPAVGALPTVLPTMLNKLNGMQSDFSIVSGLQNSAGTTCAGHHADAIARYLTGNSFQNNWCTDLYSVNDSIDQIIGKHLSGRTDASSIQKFILSAKMRNVGGADMGTGANREWGHNLSYLNNKPAYSYTNPGQMFTDTFGLPTDPQITAALKKRKSALDFLLPDIQAKRALASAEDRIILDRWLTNYEELQRTLETTGTGPVCTRPTAPAATLDAAANRGQDYNAIVRAYMDIMLASMECGIRKVGILQMQSEAADINNFYNQIVATEDLHSEVGRTTRITDMATSQHIGMAHYGSDGADMINYLKLVTLNNYYLRQYRYFVQGLKTRGLFNNSIATYGYGFKDGNHTSAPADMPFLVAGRGGGFKTGQHHRLTTLRPEQTGYNLSAMTPLPNFWASVLGKYGITYSHANTSGNTNQLFD